MMNYTFLYIHIFNVNIDTPRKICLEPTNEGLEEYVPFQLGDFRFHLIFRGVCMYVCLFCSFPFRSIRFCSVLFLFVMLCYVMLCYVMLCHECKVK